MVPGIVWSALYHLTELHHNGFYNGYFFLDLQHQPLLPTRTLAPKGFRNVVERGERA